MSPAQQAAKQLESSWRPLKAGVSYATTMFNGQPLHAVKITGPIRVGYAHVKEAVMMDGGGSARMYIPGVVDTRPGSSGRKLPSAILF